MPSNYSHFIWSLTPFRKWTPSNLRQNGLGQRHRLWFDLWNRNARAPNVDGEIGLAFFHAERILLAIRRCRVVSLVAERAHRDDLELARARDGLSDVVPARVDDSDVHDRAGVALLDRLSPLT